MRTTQVMWSAATICLAMLTAACAGQGRETTKPQQLSVRVYDVRDLLARPDSNITIPGGAEGLRPLHDVPDAAAPTLQPVTLFEDASPVTPSREDEVQALIAYIKKTSGAAWEGSGKPGKIRELNGHLIIQQTAPGHTAVTRAINEYRASRAPQDRRNHKSSKTTRPPP